MEGVNITYSEGRCRGARRYAYIRPAGKCHNRSHRVSCDIGKIPAFLEKHFPEVKYYLVDSLVIGAKDEKSALSEFWRVCEKSKIGQAFAVVEINT